MNFLKTYEASVPAVREACARIFEDIRFWKRRSFLKHRDAYCGLKPADLELPRPNSPAGIDEHLKANKTKREEMTGVLKETLERIASDAT